MFCSFVLILSFLDIAGVGAGTVVANGGVLVLPTIYLPQTSLQETQPGVSCVLLIVPCVLCQPF